MNLVQLVDYVHQLLTLGLGEFSLVQLVQFLNVVADVVVDSGDVRGDDPVYVGHYQVFVLEVPAEVEYELFDGEDALHEVHQHEDLLEDVLDVISLEPYLALALLVVLFVHADLPDVVVVEAAG